MMKVPSRAPSNIAPIPIPPDQEVYFAMAAADMDHHDRLFEDKPKPFEAEKPK